MDDFLEKKPKKHSDAALATAARFSWAILQTRNLFEPFYNLLLVKVKIIFFNFPKTISKSEYLFIFIPELQRKKKAGARQNLREILLFQREFHNEGISN